MQCSADLRVLGGKACLCCACSRAAQLAAAPAHPPQPPLCPALQPPNQATDYVVGVMSNITAALMCVANSLRHLTFETQGCLVVSQWAAALTRLESACFIGGDVHLKQVGSPVDNGGRQGLGPGGRCSSMAGNRVAGLQAASVLPLMRSCCACSCVGPGQAAAPHRSGVW